MKAKYLPILIEIAKSSTHSLEEHLKNLEKISADGNLDKMPEIEISEDEAALLISDFNVDLLKSGNYNCQGLFYSKENQDSERGLKEEEHSIIKLQINNSNRLKLNIKTFIVHKINYKSEKFEVNPKISKMWDIYDTNKQNKINLNELETLMRNYHDEKFKYFDRKTLKEMALLLFEKMDVSNLGYISREAFVTYFEEVKKKKLSSTNLTRIIKGEPKKNRNFMNFLLLNMNPIFWLFIYVFLNIFFGVYFFCISYSPDFPAVACAKFFAGIILINMSLLLLFACEKFFTLFSQSFWYAILPISNIKQVHKICAYTFIGASLGHTIIHLCWTYIHITSNSIETLNPLLYTKLEYKPTYFFLIFQTYYGLTGIILVLAILMMSITTYKAVVKKNFELFWYSHKIYYVIFITMFFHGLSRLLSNPNYWKFIVGPLFIFTFEKIIDIFIYISNKSKIISIKILDGGVIEFIVTKQRWFNNKPGQYAKINIPDLSNFQYHPFTIASGSHHPNLVFYISPVGNWTKQLGVIGRNFCHENLTELEKKASFERSKTELRILKKNTNILYYQQHPIKNMMINPYCYIDGPLGAPSQRVEKFNKLILIAGGIGATPFSSILFTLLFDIKHSNKIKYEEIHFIWVVRNIKSTLWMINLIKRVVAEETNKIFKFSLYITYNEKLEDLRSFFLWHGLELLNHNKTENVLSPCQYEHIHLGRPNFQDLLLNKRFALEKNNTPSNIGVFVCANYSICNDVFTACNQVSTQETKFIFHKENF